MNVKTIIIISIVLVTGCSSLTPKINSTPTSKSTSTIHIAPTTITISKNKAEMNIYYHPDTDETNIISYIPKPINGESIFIPDVIVDGNKTLGAHSFLFYIDSGFKGRVFSGDLKSSIVITHLAVFDDWHFTPDAKFTVTVDGDIFDIPVFSQTEFKKDFPDDLEYYEVLIAEPTYNMYAKIANGKDVTLQIGNASFKLNSDTILAFGDFVSWLTPVTVADFASRTATANAPTNKPLPKATSTPAPEPITFAGSGDSVVDVQKWSGFAITRIKYNGDRNFVVKNYSSNGDLIGILVDRIGSYEGTVALDVLDGQKTTRFEVNSSGKWEIQILPIEQVKRVNFPGTVEGNGDDVVILMGTGKTDLLKIDASQADGSFVVYGLGNSGDLLVNKIAPYTGTVIVPKNLQASNGVLMLIVTATGKWSIEVIVK